MRKHIFALGIIIVTIIIVIWCAFPFIRFAFPIHRTWFINYENYCDYAEPHFKLIKLPEQSSEIKYYVGYFRAREFCGVSFRIPEENCSDLYSQLTDYMELYKTKIYSQKKELESLDLDVVWLKQHGMENIYKIINKNDDISDYKIVDYFNSELLNEIVVILVNEEASRFVIAEFYDWSDTESEETINP